MYKLSSLPEEGWINFKIASVRTVSNHHTKEYKNYPAYLRRGGWNIAGRNPKQKVGFFI